MMQNAMHTELDGPDEGQSRLAEADRLRREHGEIKARLVELNGRLYLSPQEQLERKTLQKLKLAKKDRIAVLMVNYSGNS